MRLLNIAKCKFVITDKEFKKISVGVGGIVDVDDITAQNLLKSYPNSWKNLDIIVNENVEEIKSELVEDEIVGGGEEKTTTTKTTRKKK